SEAERKLAAFKFDLRQNALKNLSPTDSQIPFHIDEGLPLETRKQPEALINEKQMQDELKRAQEVYDNTRTAAEKYSDEIADLTDMLNKGQISQDTFDRAVTQAAAKLPNTNKLWEDLGNKIGDTVEQAALFGRSWSDAFKSIIIEITRAILQMTLFQKSAGGGGFLGSLLGGLLGGGGI